MGVAVAAMGGSPRVDAAATHSFGEHSTAATEDMVIRRGDEGGLPVASDLSRRLATAAIAGPIAAACVIAGGVWLTALVLAASAICMWEIAFLQRTARPEAFLAVALPAAWAFPLAAVLDAPFAGWLLLTLATVGGLAGVARVQRKDAAAPLGASSSVPTGLPLEAWGLAIAGGLYVGALLASVIWLRGRTDGLVWATLVVAGTWACDSAAFVVGSRWGRHKLATTVSPNKSVEGFAAGAAAAVLVVVLGAFWWHVPVPRVALLGLVVGVGALAGDLLESALKRQLGAKDSGWILPGHGGVMDRVDSLLLTLFLGYLYVVSTDGWFGR